MHIFGLAFGVGGASAKFALFMKSYSDKESAPVFIKFAKPISQLILLGLILLTVSGIGWAALGYPEKQMLVVKHILVAVLWVVGILINNVYEPKLHRLAPTPGQSLTSGFFQVQKQLLALEAVGTICFYTIAVLGVLLE